MKNKVSLFSPIKRSVKKIDDFYNVDSIALPKYENKNERLIYAHSYYEIFRNCSIHLFNQLLYNINNLLNKFNLPELNLKALGLDESNNHGIDFLTDLLFYKKNKLSINSIQVISKHCASIFYNSIDIICPDSKKLNAITRAYEIMVSKLISILNTLANEKYLKMI